MKRLVIVWVAASALTLTTRASATAERSTPGAETTRKVYISAFDSSRTPVTDLKASDIIVKENGKERPVASLEPASAPMHVAILVDDAGTGAFQSGVAQFLQKALGRGRFSITLLNPQATTILDFTDDVAALKTALGRLGQRGRLQPDGDQMLDAIVQASKALQQQKAERPVILSLTLTGGQAQSVQPDDVLTTLRSSGAMLNVVFLTGADVGMVMGDGPKQSGGRLEQVGGGEAIGPAMVRIADSLEHQYQLTYTLPDGVRPSDRLSVATSRKGITLTAPTRIAAR
jgi:hypothetical protein